MRIVIIPACCYFCPRLDEVSNPGFYTAHQTSSPSQTNPWQQALLRSRSIWPGRSPRIVPILVAQFAYSLNYWSGLQIWSIMKHGRCFLLSLALTSCIHTSFVSLLEPVRASIRNSLTTFSLEVRVHRCVPHSTLSWSWMRSWVVELSMSTAMRVVRWAKSPLPLIICGNAHACRLVPGKSYFICRRSN